MAEVRTLTIDEQTAKRLYELYSICRMSDQMLPCQNNLFRSQIAGCYKAANVQAAFDILSKFLNGKGDQG